MMMIMMMMVLKMVLLPLLLLQALLTGVCSRTPREMHVKAGEMVALTCRHSKGYSHSDGRLRWTSYTPEQTDVTDGMLDVLVQGRSLVILKASVNHQGNYSCSLGNASRVMWFRLNVYTTNSREYERKTTYTRKCFAQESCILKCPKVNAPVEKNLNITNTNILWHKGEDSFSNYYYYYFPSVKENDSGVYTCTRSYLYRGQIYNMTMRVSLDVRPKIIKKTAAIISPKMNAVFEVELGAPAVIPCEAVLSSSFDEVYWLSGERNKTFIKTNSSLPVYYNVSRETSAEGKKMTASLVFQKVSEEDLSKQYTCKLATFQNPSNVTIFLKQKTLVRPSYVSLAASVVSVVAVMVLAVVIYVKFKISITLFLRDTLGCHRSSSDEKSYDAFVMCYKSDADKGLSEHDIKRLKNDLEERFGYSLCLYDRDVLPGEAVAEAVLDCIEQSRTVLLVPTSPDPCLGSGLLSAIHAALVERETRLVFITTEAAKVSRSGPLPEAIHQLGDAGDCVTWKGESSMSPSSFFWKKLRYYLHAPQSVSKIRLLPQDVSDGSP
ncbi:uncharacterized protein V6R79_022798 [Siganus canaliculatus]